MWRAGIAISIGACYQPTRATNCELDCTTACPEGLVCSDGFCVTPGTPPGACGAVPDGMPPEDLLPDLMDPLTLCPDTYEKVGAGFYRLQSQSSSWPAAETACENDVPLGGPVFTHLAAITTETERMDLAFLITQNTWIGLTDEDTGGTWVHVTDESTVYPGSTGFPWGTDEPNGNEGENCAHLLVGTVRIHDFGCANPLEARLCECDTHPQTPKP